MKGYLFSCFTSLQRPIAIMLALITAGLFLVNYWFTGLVIQMAELASQGDPNVTEMLRGFGTVSREYGLPVLTLTTALAVLNLFSAFCRAPAPK
jgi:amino acid transporter